MTILIVTLIIALALAALAYRQLTRSKVIAVENVSSENDLKSAPPLDKFQLYRLNKRWQDRWLKARFSGKKLSRRDGAWGWMMSQMSKINAQVQSLRDDLAQLQTGEKKRRAGRHSLAYMKPLSAAQKRRAARLRRESIRRSAEFIRAMREEKGLIPVVLTARQQTREQREKYRNRDIVLWRELKASA